MSNPFSGIITSDLKTLYNNMIDALLENTALTRPCLFTYGDTKFTDCPNCFSSDAIINTSNGYKRIDNIDIGDMVFDGNVYNKVSRIYKRVYSGKLFNIKCYGISLPTLVTANHKFPIIRNFRQQYTQSQWYDNNYVIDNLLVEEVCAEDLTLDDALILPFNISNTNYLDYIDSPFGPIAVDDDLLFFIGWWLAEGCVHVSKYPRQVSFCLRASKEDCIADKLIEILYNKFSVIGKKEFRQNADNLLVHWYSSKLAKFMLSFGHLSYNKCIPINILNQLSLEQKEKILVAYHCGDGHICNKSECSIFNRKSITTTSRILAHQIFDILFDLNYLPSISYKNEYIDKNNVSHKENYTVSWLEDRIQQKSGIRKSNIGWLSQIREINQKTDIIYVYNIEVEQSHKYVVNNILTNNCTYDAINGRSSGRYQTGGPINFNHGICPYCHGIGRIPDEQTETLYLMVIYNMGDVKGLLNLSPETLANPGNYALTLSSLSSTYTKIKKAKEVVLDTDIDNYMLNRFVRYAEPEPIGWGSDRYILTTWKRAQ